MDPTTHTILSTALLFVAYKVGRHFGYRDGLVDVWASLLSVFNAKKMVINDNDELIITDKNGNERKIN